MGVEPKTRDRNRLVSLAFLLCLIFHCHAFAVRWGIVGFFGRVEFPHPLDIGVGILSREVSVNIMHGLAVAPAALAHRGGFAPA